MMGCLMSCFKWMQTKKTSYKPVKDQPPDDKTNDETNGGIKDINDKDINPVATTEIETAEKLKEITIPVVTKLVVAEAVIKIIEPETCPQCYEETLSLEIVFLKCGHKYCRTCYYNTIFCQKLDPTSKICAVCCNLLESSDTENNQDILKDPVPLNSNLKEIDQLSEMLKYYNLGETKPSKTLELLSITPEAYKFAIFRVLFKDSEQTVIQLYLIPDTSTSEVFYELHKNDSDAEKKFNQRLFDLVSQDYSIWFFDQETRQTMTDPSQLGLFSISD